MKIFTKSISRSPFFSRDGLDIQYIIRSRILGSRSDHIYSSLVFCTKMKYFLSFTLEGSAASLPSHEIENRTELIITNLSFPSLVR
jgi:hypothetical protein